MELREAVEEIRKYHGKGGWWEGSDLSDDPDAFDDAIAEILNAIIDGTLIPAEQCFSVKEGYYGRMYKHSDNPALMYVTTVPLTEALEIRSADDVRREGYAEGYKDGFKKSGWEEMQRQTALIPAEQTEQCFSVREGYRVSSRLGAYMDVPLSEALEIRSADDVRREAFSETLDLFESRPDAVKVIRALIDTPQPKGGDDE